MNNLKSPAEKLYSEIADLVKRADQMVVYIRTNSGGRHLIQASNTEQSTLESARAMIELNDSECFKKGEDRFR